MISDMSSLLNMQGDAYLKVDVGYHGGSWRGFIKLFAELELDAA
jgi:hypothetical protein